MNPDPAAAAGPANLTDATVGIVVSDWHSELTSAMLDGTIQCLQRCGVELDDIFVAHVPSVLELPFAARQMSLTQEPKAVVMLGCCIHDEDPQYQIAEHSIAHATTELNLHSDIPCLCGVFFTQSVAEAQSLCTSQRGSEIAEKVQKVASMMANLVIR